MNGRLIKRMALWVLGFVLLALINLLAETVLLPLWGLNNTSKNDVYFITWWIVVGAWFLFGNTILAAFDGSRTQSRC